MFRVAKIYIPIKFECWLLKDMTQKVLRRYTVVYQQNTYVVYHSNSSYGIIHLHDQRHGLLLYNQRNNTRIFINLQNSKDAETARIIKAEEEGWRFDGRGASTYQRQAQWRKYVLCYSLLCDLFGFGRSIQWLTLQCPSRFTWTL
jgi:hypothetical protein